MLIEKQEQKAVVFDRLIPILFVEDLQAEQDFYINLGFTATSQESGSPDLITLTYGSIEFGIERLKSFAPENPNRVLTWRFGIRDIDVAKQWLTQAVVRFREEWVTLPDDRKYRALHVRTPNGYHLFLEEPGE